jgi:diguanylate cyclase (GGDEF)-like protein
MVGNIAEKIVAALAVPVSFEGHSLPVSVSVGVCTASAGDLEAETILRNADVALYRAKERGRGCYEVFTPALDYVKTAEEL